MNLMDKSCASTVYITPPEILDRVREHFDGQINLDPATEPNNPTDAECFCALPEHNGLEAMWIDRTFLNPPYGKDLKVWTEKLRRETQAGAWIVALLPGQRFETLYWQENVLNESLDYIVFIRKRVPFLRPDGSRAENNPYGSMLYIYNALRHPIDCFRPLGKIIKVRYA